EHAEIAELDHELPPPIELEDVLADHEVRTCGRLLADATGPFTAWRSEHGRRRTEQEPRSTLQPTSAFVAALVPQPPRQSQQVDRVEIEHWLGLRVVADDHVVPGDEQHVADAEAGRTQEIALERDPIAVSARERRDRLDPLALDPGRGRHARHVI